MDLLTFLRTHFIHAAPILFMGVLAVAIVGERFVALFLNYPMRDMNNFMSRVSQAVMKAKIKEAISYCDDEDRKLAAKVVKAGLSRSHLPENLIQDGIQMALLRCSQTLMKRTNFLGTIANVSTLLGLLGTIAGLVQSFEAVGYADAQQKAALLSSGIATSMNATMLGLAVAIPCILAYSFLMNKSNQLIADLEQAAVQINDVLKQRFYASEFIETALLVEDKKSRKS